MTVLKGEGKVPILFGSTSIAAGSRTHAGYLARPDLAGEWPTILTIHSVWGISSSVKDICRRLARQGFAVVAVDLFAGRGPKRSDGREAFVEATDALDETAVSRRLVDVVDFIRNPAGFWSSAEDGFGVLAIGTGIRFVPALLRMTSFEALALAYAKIASQQNDALGAYDGSILGIWGVDDDVADLEAARGLRQAHPRTEVVLYGDVGHAFLDDNSDDYDLAAANDALERFTEFFSKHLPPPPSA